MTYLNQLEAWEAQAKPDYFMHANNPLVKLRECWKAQDNWAPLIIAQTGICVAHVQAPPGCGKTATAATLCHSLNQAIVGGELHRWSRPLGFLRILPNTRVPEDFSGYPVAGELNGSKVMLKLEDIQLAMAEQEAHVVLLDELADVHESIQAAMLGYMDKRHGQSIFLAASNPEETATNPTPLRPAFVSRMFNCRWNENPTHWAQRAAVFSTSNGSLAEEFPPLPVPLVPDDWAASAGQWNAILANFVDCHPRDTNLDDSQWHYQTPGKFSNACNADSDRQHLPFPCDRTRHLCALGLSAGTATGASEHTLREITRGFLGEYASDSFWAWYGRMDIPSGESLLDDPSRFGEPSTPMEANLKVMAAMAHWRSHPDRWLDMMALLDLAYDHSKDLAQSFFPCLMHKKPDGTTLPESAAINAMAKVSFEVHEAVGSIREGRM